MLKYLDNLRKKIKDDWASGAYTDTKSDGTVQLNAQKIGEVIAITNIINLDYDELMEGIKEDE